MKTLTKFVTGASMALLFSSCEKEYSCYCQVQDMASGQTQSSYSKTGTFTKKNAESWCALSNDSNVGLGLRTTCTLH